MSTEPNGADGLLLLLYSLNNGACKGTGVVSMINIARNLLGSEIPPVLLHREVGYLNNLFGNYPTVLDDLAPSIVFSLVFFILGILHLGLFMVNWSRGHFFYLTFLWFIYDIGKSVGFALRAKWSTNVTLVDLGITSEVLLIVFSVFLTTTNLILAQRLFTWRHPVGGSRKLFNNIMLVLYTVVILVVFMTIFCSAIPYYRFLSRSAFQKYKNAIKASAVLIFLYSLTAISLLALSYFFKPTRKDENLYTYQPWWVESFHPFYFVKKHAARQAEDTFMKRNHNHRHAVRVIAATHHEYNMVEGLTNERGNLKHNMSIIIVLLTTLIDMTNAILRGIACFQDDASARNNPICQSFIVYISWGVLETLMNIIYLVGRADLRFYRPDILPAKVRSIITAEQSFFASRNASPHGSDIESDDDISEFETDPSSIKLPYYDNDEKFDDKFENFDTTSSNDNESEFNF